MSTQGTLAQHRESIWRIVHSIPPGKVISYGDVAKRAGLPNGARLVGRALSNLPSGSALPWHRVINSRGTISLPLDSDGYREQHARLVAEGIVFRNGRIDWRLFGWRDASRSD